MSDVVVLTEHGLKEDELRNTVLNEYTLITGFCRKKYLKDGVAIYAKNDVESLTESMNTQHTPHQFRAYM